MCDIRLPSEPQRVRERQTINISLLRSEDNGSYGANELLRAG